MKPYYAEGPVTLFHGDCIEVLRTLPDESVHAVVTDPPYGISFMGKQWDQPGQYGSTRKNGQPAVHMREAGRAREAIGDTGAMEAGRYDLSPTAMQNFQAWCEAWAAECLRVLKPGGHLLAFGGSRTWHRLAAGIEDAGFEIRDSIAWLYGSGFPKSLDVSKAIDAHLGADRASDVLSEGPRAVGSVTFGKTLGRRIVQRAASASASAWDGWGTALKPSFEPIVVGRKPLNGTVASNVLAHGTGALNIDATRVSTDEDLSGGAYSENGARAVSGSLSPSGLNRAGATVGYEFVQPCGRWPSNVVMDDSQAAALDEQSGVLTSGLMRARTNREPRKGGVIYGADKRTITSGDTYADSGGASRFFPTFSMSDEDWFYELAVRQLPTFRYEAKAPSSERPKHGEVQHPTVKPLDLMQWLVRLVTPADGVVLEPFAGSGTTVEACLREGFTCIAIEREADYLPLILQRVRKDHQQGLFGELDGIA